MKFLHIVLYILAVVLLLGALVMLYEVFTARRAVEAILFPYLFLLGGTGPIVENLTRAVVSSVQTLFLVLFCLCLLGSGLMFGLARLMSRVERQSQRIKELEGEVARLRLAPAGIPPGEEIPGAEAAVKEAHSGEVLISPETKLAQTEEAPGEAEFRPVADSLATGETAAAGLPAEELSASPENNPES